MVKPCEVCGNQRNRHTHEICQELEEATKQWQIYRKFTSVSFNQLREENPERHCEHMKGMDELAEALNKMAKQADEHDQHHALPRTLEALKLLKGQLDAHRAAIYPAATPEDFENWLSKRKKNQPDV